MNLDYLKNLTTPPPVGFQTSIAQPLLPKVKSEGELIEQQKDLRQKLGIKN